jgi:hypothetical protein
MDEHRRIEIAAAEDHRDVRQVGTDRVAVLGVGGIVDADVDRAPSMKSRKWCVVRAWSKPITMAPRWSLVA